MLLVAICLEHQQSESWLLRGLPWKVLFERASIGINAVGFSHRRVGTHWFGKVIHILAAEVPCSDCVLRPSRLHWM